MRKLFSIINLFLCLELIAAPIAPQINFFVNRAQAQSEGDCPEGLSRDSITNRCITSAQTAAILNATSSCAVDDHECYKTNAQSALQSEVNKDGSLERKGNNGFVSTVANIGSIAGPLIIAISGLKSAKPACTSASMWLMIGASATVYGAELIANLGHRKRLKKIKDNWGEIVNPEAETGDKDLQREASINAQSLAFGKLAESEDSLVKAANLKKTAYMAASLAFTAAGIIAGIESISDIATGGLKKAANLCKSATASSSPKFEAFAFENTPKAFMLEHQFHYNLETSKDLATFLINKKAMELSDRSPSIDEFNDIKMAFSHTSLDRPQTFKVIKGILITTLKNLSPLQESYADSNAAKAYKEDKGKGFDWAGTSLGVAAGIGAGLMIAKKTITSEQRAIFAGVMAGLTLQMSLHGGSQAKASKNRAELLRKMEVEFKTASGAIYSCKSEDRNNPGKPHCYCYTPENTKNPNRTNSSVCNALFKGSLADAKNYYQDDSGDRICVTKTNQADPSCDCKKTNSCLKVSLSGLKGLNTGTMSMLDQAIAPLNSLASGGSAANINKGMNATLATNLNKLQKQVESNPNLKDFVKNKEKNSSGLMQELNKAGSSIPSSNLLGSSGNSGMPTNPGEAAKMLEKELEPQTPVRILGNGTSAAPSNDNANSELEFGFTNEERAAQENQLAEVMNTKLDYGKNDINQGSTTNIFEVLSNRYQRSAMRRLFDEQGGSTLEKAAATDINQ